MWSSGWSPCPSEAPCSPWYSPRRASLVGLVADLATFAARLALLWQVATASPLRDALGGWTAGLGIGLHADGLAAALLLMTGAVALGVSVYASGCCSRAADRERFWPLWLLLWTALNALLLAADLFNIYVTLELLGLSAVALAALGGKRAALEGGGVALPDSEPPGLQGFLAGVALICTAHGSLNLVTVADWVAMALMTAGLLIETALFPLHLWLPPAHANAPAPVSAALSALVVKAGFYLMLRLRLDLFAPVTTPAAAQLPRPIGGDGGTLGLVERAVGGARGQREGTLRRPVLSGHDPGSRGGAVCGLRSHRGRHRNLGAYPRPASRSG
jgi:formate hydrogenlyase subunit 3/multisubunit Na+/H+ antiporter MnhD subunit